MAKLKPVAEEPKKKKKLQPISEDVKTLKPKKKKKKKLEPVEEVQTLKKKKKAKLIEEADSSCHVPFSISKEQGNKLASKAIKRMKKKLKDGWSIDICIVHHPKDTKTVNDNLYFFKHYKPTRIFKAKHVLDNVSVIISRKRTKEELAEAMKNKKMRMMMNIASRDE